MSRWPACSRRALSATREAAAERRKNSAAIQAFGSSEDSREVTTRCSMWRKPCVVVCVCSRACVTLSQTRPDTPQEGSFCPLAAVVSRIRSDVHVEGYPCQH